MILRLLSKALSMVVLVLVLISEAQPCSVPNIRDKRGNVPKVVDVIAGKDVKLTCQVNETGVITTWLKNNKTIGPSDHPRMRLKMNRFLKIKRVQIDDAGFYTCVAENDCGIRTYTMQLFVRNAPKFIVPPRKLSRNFLALPAGNSVKLDCSADGYPRPTVTWYKDGARFMGRKGGRRLYLRQGKLLLYMADLVPTDTGKYTCNVSNAYGWINHTYYVDVHERLHAEPVVLPMDNVTVSEGEKATLLCKALSDSMPHFQWLRWRSSPSNGTTNSTIEFPLYENIKPGLNHVLLSPLPRSNNKSDFWHGEKLTLVNVTKEDEGKYTCIVGNALGFVVEPAYIIVYRLNDKQEQDVSQKHENTTDVTPTVSAQKEDKSGKKPARASKIQYPKILIAMLAGVIVLAIITAGVCYWQFKKVRASLPTAKSRRPEIDSLRAKYEVQNEYVVVPDYSRSV